MPRTHRTTQEPATNANSTEQLLARDAKADEYAYKLNQYSKRLGTLMAQQKKLFRIRERLVDMKEPVLFLKRHNGDREIYHNVKETEFIIPNTEKGVEKKLILGHQWQEQIPYAGRTFRAYWCHENWLYPHKWSEPNIYQGPAEDAPNTGWILEQANINSEVFRDRERKVLNSWEKYKTNAKQIQWMEIAKAVAIGVGAIIIILWIMQSGLIGNILGGGPAAAPVTVAVPAGPEGVIIG